MNSSIWSINGTLTATTILDRSVPGSNEEILHVPKAPGLKPSLSDAVQMIEIPERNERKKVSVFLQLYAGP